MIIQLNKGITVGERASILEKLKKLKYKSTEVITQEGEYLVGIGKNEFDIRDIGLMPGIADIHRVTDNYKLVSSKWKVRRSRIDLGDGVLIGEGSLAIMAGPCSIESEENIQKTIRHLRDNGIRIMRGGVYKPRSSPYSFRGHGLEMLRLWHSLTKPEGIKIITEVMQVSQIAPMYDYVDIYQVGARNTQNYNLLDELGKTDKPVMIKRGISGTIDELLYSAEYVFSGGNERIILCERGIRTYENAARNTLDLNAIPVLLGKTHLPVIVDPSHGIGIRDYIEPMALAGIMCGADGIIYETHELPEEALSDGQQTVDFRESGKMVERIRKAYSLRNNM
ncbi:MAG TPA: 3-deoxy-7-phosphoheptulonate synthase [Cyclobacteriaceae bacterium]|nr:3-deoxy-7-phosphoheptulonate synthase [Cyclobacteriaceae bacterium]